MVKAIVRSPLYLGLWNNISQPGKIGVKEKGKS
jgi:hypothetical protein